MTGGVKEVWSAGEGGVRLNILADKCPTCIFRPGNLMALRPGRLAGMVAACARQQTHIVCHDTLADGAEGAVCRGFFDAYPDTSQLVRIAQRLRAVRFVPPPDQTA